MAISNCRQWPIVLSDINRRNRMSSRSEHSSVSTTHARSVRHVQKKAAVCVLQPLNIGQILRPPCGRFRRFPECRSSRIKLDFRKRRTSSRIPLSSGQLSRLLDESFPAPTTTTEKAASVKHVVSIRSRQEEESLIDSEAAISASGRSNPGRREFERGDFPPRSDYEIRSSLARKIADSCLPKRRLVAVPNHG